MLIAALGEEAIAAVFLTGHLLPFNELDCSAVRRSRSGYWRVGSGVADALHPPRTTTDRTASASTMRCSAPLPLPRRR
jgi:hypothetical protein